MGGNFRHHSCEQLAERLGAPIILFEGKRDARDVRKVIKDCICLSIPHGIGERNRERYAQCLLDDAVGMTIHKTVFFQASPGGMNR